MSTSDAAPSTRTGTGAAVASIACGGLVLLFYVLVLIVGGVGFIFLISPFVVGVWVLAILAVVLAMLAIRRRRSGPTITALIIAVVAALVSAAFGVLTNFAVTL